MVCEHILGKLKDIDTKGLTVEYVDIEWFEAFKRIHSKVTSQGRPIGIRMDDSILKTGLVTGDIIYEDDELIISVNTPPCEVTYIQVDFEHAHMVAKVCYEIGNRHAPLFWGESNLTFITPYDEPIYRMLEQMHGVQVEKKVVKLDFDHKISAQVSSHHH